MPRRWNDWSAPVLILSYIEQTTLHNAINFANTGVATHPILGAPNYAAFLAQVTAFQCPSDNDRLTNVEGHINYYGNAGSTPASLSTSSQLDGLFLYILNWPKAVMFRDIADGSSNTAAFSERVKGYGTLNRIQIDTEQPTSSVWAMSVPSTTTSPQLAY